MSSAVQAVTIIGAGGFGREVVEYCEDAVADGWRATVTGFLDDFNGAAAEPEGVPLLGGLDLIESSDLNAFIIAIGAADSRRAIALRVARAGKALVTLTHPSAYVSRTATVGDGVVLCPFSFVGSHSSVAMNVAINLYASVGHDARVGAHTVLSPYAAITGAAQLGEACFVGTNAAVAPGVTVGTGSKIAASSYVHKSAPSGSLLVGSPARGRVMFAVPSSE